MTLIELRALATLYGVYYDAELQVLKNSEGSFYQAYFGFWGGYNYSSVFSSEERALVRWFTKLHLNTK